MWIQDKFRENWEWLQTQTFQNILDPYWYQVAQIINQINGKL